MNTNIRSLHTPFGTVSKLQNGNYRLERISEDFLDLLSNEQKTFNYLIDEGFVIKSFKYLWNKSDDQWVELKKMDPNENKIECLADIVDLISLSDFNPAFSKTSLVVELQRYSKIDLGITLCLKKLKVIDINHNGIADESGIQKEDQLKFINDKKLSSISDLKKYMNIFSKNEKFYLTVERKGNLKKIDIKL